MAINCSHVQAIGCCAEVVQDYVSLMCPMSCGMCVGEGPNVTRLNESAWLEASCPSPRPFCITRTVPSSKQSEPSMPHFEGCTLEPEFFINAFKLYLDRDSERVMVFMALALSLLLVAVLLIPRLVPLRWRKQETLFTQEMKWLGWSAKPALALNEVVSRRHRFPGRLVVEMTIVSSMAQIGYSLSYFGVRTGLTKEGATLNAEAAVKHFPCMLVFVCTYGMMLYLLYLMGFICLNLYLGLQSSKTEYPRALRVARFIAVVVPIGCTTAALAGHDVTGTATICQLVFD